MDSRKSEGNDEQPLPATAPLIRSVLNQVFVLLAFFGLTAVMTWPWVTRLRDAVSDEGDPYMIAWTLWWNYHQTFTDPLNLFHANVFYPYRYTLAFSEHEYGIALLCFPLFAMGLRPLTVHSFVTFAGFAFCGYGTFRLTRTLTGSQRAAWIAGIVFAFVPYRFHVLSHLHYLFAGWIPLLLEALVLFARRRTWGRAAWLGIAFTMNALTCTTYFILTLVPLSLSAGFLLVHYEIVRDRVFWLRGAAAIGAAMLVLLPFMLPYYFVMKLYGFVRTIDDVAVNSASPLNWLVVDGRNKLWQGLGEGVPGSAHHKLFPGLLPVLLALPLFFSTTDEPVAVARDTNTSRRRVLTFLDAGALVGTIVMLVAAGYTGSTAELFGIEMFRHVTAARMLFLVMVVVLVRSSLAYPNAWRWTREQNLIDSLRASKRGDAFALCLIWVVCGFLGSLGTNFFLNTILFDFVPPFRAIRIPTHWAMIAYLGLAVLAGCGVELLAQRFKAWRPGARPLLVNVVVVAVALLLLFELRGAPLGFVRGKVFPDEITLRLKQTSMRGGLVELPHDLGRALPHRYMLRAADHQKPLVNASSSFISPLTWEISQVTGTGQIPLKFVDLLESIPASYLVIHNSAVLPERRLDYESFLVKAVASGRLRFIRSFGERDDLYAVVKTEPQAVSEAPLPFAGEVRDWSQLNREEPANLVGRFRAWGQAVYRFHVASFGQMPRYAEFIPEIELIGRGVVVGSENEQANLDYSISRFADAWAAQARFQARFGSLTNEEFVDNLAANAGIVLEPSERADVSDKLNQSTMTRANVLLWFVNKREFIEKEDKRSLVLLSYFGYLHRNPDDPPDKDMRGFDYWLKAVEASGNVGRLLQAFRESIEHERRGKK